MTFHISEFELSVPYQAFAVTCSTSRHFDILIHQITPKRSTFLPDMSTAVAANAVFFRFPLELRRNIYFQYLIAMYRPSPWMLYKHTRKDWSPFDPSLFRVNLQIQREMVDVTRQQRRFCYRISSQEATFDGLALLCFRILDKTFRYEEIQHLTVEIYPPHPDRPIDMVHIWRRVQKFYEELRAAHVIPHLSISFMEDKIAKWSTNAQPHNTMETMQYTTRPKQSTNCDIGFILDAFARLTNVKEAAIHLPTTLEAHEDLQLYAQGVRDSMTNVHPFDQTLVEVNYELLIYDIENNEPDIRVATGKRSAAKLEAFYGDDPRLTDATLKRFQDLWPHIDDLGADGQDGADRYLDWGPIHSIDYECIAEDSTDTERLAESEYGKPSWL